MSDKMKLPMMAVFEQIVLERLRQEDLFRQGKFNYTCASPVADPSRKLAILTEEVGEVAKEVLHLDSKHHNQKQVRANLRAELIQVAAVAVGWLQSLEPDKE